MPKPVSPAVRRRLVRVKDLLRGEFRRGPTIDELVRTSGLSRAFFMRGFVSEFGITPHRYLTELRMQQAKLELARGESVTEACLASGYSSLGSFSAEFTRRFGLSPRAYRREARAVVSVLGVPALWIPQCFLLRYAPETFGEVLDAGGC
jgi:AraC-like DNA-binding protein